MFATDNELRIIIKDYNMDIRPLCGRLGLKVCEAERQKRMWQTRLAQAMRKPPLTSSIPQIIRTD